MLEKFAKAQCDGLETGATKADWMAAIESRCDEIYDGLPLSKEQKFSKCIGGNAHMEGHAVVDMGDRLGKLYFAAMKAAPRAPAPPFEPPVDIAKAVASRAGTANAQMLELARARQKVFPAESDAAAFVHVWEDPKNGALKQAAVEENWNLLGVGDTQYMARQNATYANPHPAGSGKRPNA